MLFNRCVLLGLVGLAAAAPTAEAEDEMPLVASPQVQIEEAKEFESSRNKTAARLAPDCNNLVAGLSFDDCVYMSNIGMAGQGENSFGNNGNVWIGDDGPNRFRFTNTGPGSLTLILWVFDGDFSASFMNVRNPKISYSLANPGDGVVISAIPGISMGWATLNNRQTTLSQFGQIFNTWGEATTGNGGPGSATVNVSRLVNMNGNPQSISIAGCRADMDFCSFQCKNGAVSCGESGTYDLLNCTPDVNPNSGTGTFDGINPEGGCFGWDNGGDIIVDLGS